jgi:lysophospholipase L1-like esterase
MLAEYGGRAALVAASILVSLILLELGVRVWHGGGALLDWTSEFANDRIAHPAGGQFAYHPVQGFVPQSNFVSTAVNHDARGLRVTPGAGLVDGPAILAVGDSYTYGDDVADAESWPSYLQNLGRQRILNGGVSGYGLDQIVLQAERLVPALRPNALILSFIADDIRRMEMSRLWGIEKPYFALAGGALELRHVPVPPNQPRRAIVSAWHRVMGWSHLVGAIERRVLFDREEWTGHSQRVLPRRASEPLLCPLMARVAALGLPTVVVAQYDPLVWRYARYGREEQRLSRLALDCAAGAGLATLDLHTGLDAAVRAQGYDALFVGVHHTAEGNRAVADAIAAELRRRGLLPAP